MQWYQARDRKEVLVTGVNEEWRIVIDALVDYLEEHPRSKKIKDVHDKLIKMPVF